MISKFIQNKHRNIFLLLTSSSSLILFHMIQFTKHIHTYKNTRHTRHTYFMLKKWLDFMNFKRSTNQNNYLKIFKNLQPKKFNFSIVQPMLPKDKEEEIMHIIENACVEYFGSKCESIEIKSKASILQLMFEKCGNFQCFHFRLLLFTTKCTLYSVSELELTLTLSIVLDANFQLTIYVI